ncbi:unnamed protein product [Camellia sinensis]
MLDEALYKVYFMFGHNCLTCSVCYDKGYGHMTHQLQQQEMRPSTVDQRSCQLSGIVNQTIWYLIQHHMSGIVNQTVWYLIQHHMNMFYSFSCWRMMFDCLIPEIHVCSSCLPSSLSHYHLKLMSLGT